MFTCVCFTDSWGDLLILYRRSIFHSKSLISEGQIENGHTAVRSSDLIWETWQDVSPVLCRKPLFYLSEKSEELSLNLPRFCCQMHCNKFVVLYPHKHQVVMLHLHGRKKRESKAEERCQAQICLFKMTIAIMLHQDSLYCRRSPGFAGEGLTTCRNHLSPELFSWKPKASATAELFSCISVLLSEQPAKSFQQLHWISPGLVNNNSYNSRIRLKKQIILYSARNSFWKSHT